MNTQFLERNGHIRVIVNRISPWKILDNTEYDNLLELVIRPFLSGDASITLVVSDRDLENLKRTIDRALPGGPDLINTDDKPQSPTKDDLPDGGNYNQESTKSLPGQKTMFD